jgi:threonine dehydratase
MFTLDTAPHTVITDVPEDLILDTDRIISADDRLRMRTVSGDEPLSGYFGNRRVQSELLAQEKAAGRLGISELERMDGVVLDTLHAQQRLQGITNITPLVDVSGLLGNERVRIHLKHEGQQPVKSYKLRGAYGAMTLKQPAMQSEYVVTDSAGNHAWGVSAAAAQLGLKAIIFMPENTPRAKRDPVIACGAQIFAHGKNYSEAVPACQNFRDTHPEMTYIPPFDDTDVILHQGTIAAEIFQQEQSPTDYIFVPIGGGGAISGIAQYAKAVRPHIKVIGVEYSGSDAMSRSLAAHKRVKLPSVDTFAEGVAVQQVGGITFDIASRHVDDMVVVSKRELARGVCELDDAGLTAEGAGALAFVGARRYFAKHPRATGNVVGLLSGSNIDIEKLQLARELAA